MKGIIVVDMPETCLDCGFCEEIDEGTFACCTIVLDEKSLYGRVIDADYCQNKPDWCPIKPVPEKKEFPECFMYGELYGEEIGWNECIDEILKGE